MTHNHAEAFCLMWYACECGHRERIWNSRDGVTAFGFGCPSCGNTCLHVDWKLDHFFPQYKPYRGQRFWRDGTVEDAVAIINRRDQQQRIPAGIKLRMMQNAIENIGEWIKGWPMLDVAP